MIVEAVIGGFMGVVTWVVGVLPTISAPTVSLTAITSRFGILGVLLPLTTMAVWLGVWVAVQAARAGLIAWLWARTLGRP